MSETLAADETLVNDGIQISRTTGTKAMDALRIASAIRMGTDDFVTAENPSKPMFREKRIPVRHINDA